MRDFTYIMTGLFFFCLSLTVLKAQNVYVLEKNGLQTSYVIADLAKLHFSSGELTVEMQNGASDNYNLADIRYMNFTGPMNLPSQIIPERPEMKLFPNPVSGILHISYYIPGGKSVRFEIISLDGKLLHRENLPAENRMLNWQTNLTKLPEGLYVCRLFSGKSRLTKSFIKN